MELTSAIELSRGQLSTDSMEITVDLFNEFENILDN